MVYYTIVRRVGNDRAAKDAARKRGLEKLLPLFGVPTDTRMEKDGLGRPCLPECPALAVSLSHADPFTVVAVGSAPVGVDLEREDRIRDPEALARRFFTPREAEEVTSFPHPQRAALAVWTRKEALGKYIGTGLADTMKICTSVPPEGAAFYTEWLEEAGVRYALTLCAKDRPTFVAIEEDR